MMCGGGENGGDSWRDTYVLRGINLHVYHTRGNEGSERSSIDRLIQIAVRENDEGCLAPQLRGHMG